MIIHKGLGILVIGAAAVGFLAGALLSGSVFGTGASMGVGLVFAALGNWGLWKLIPPRASGKPAHSLFFIPAKAWTWILAGLVIPGAVIDISVAKSKRVDAATPGHAAFTAADDLIAYKSKGAGACHGSTASAKAAASVFSAAMKETGKGAFTGGTGGEFLTYCHHAKDSIVFLCQVPDLRKYKAQESKAALADIAWASGKHAAKTVDPEAKKTVIVGLRGLTSTYHFILKGSPADEKPARFPTSEKNRVLYEPFANPPDDGATAAP